MISLQYQIMTQEYFMLTIFRIKQPNDSLSTVIIKLRIKMAWNERKDEIKRNIKLISSIMCIVRIDWLLS